MPSDNFFGVSVLIAGRPVPEYAYAKESRVYVESNLYTPFSYYQKTEQVVNGEVEMENTPVTPYQVQVRLAAHSESSAVFVYVDGVLASKFMLEKAQSKIIRGFEDKEGIREFLFALPRFAADEGDRISSKRESHIGTIEVVRYLATYVKQEYRQSHDTSFNQATKKDAYRVTAGKYTMSTTKKGKLIHQVKPYDVQLKKLWRIGQECGRLTVHYRMGHTLESMGISLVPTNWTRIVGRKSSEERSSSTSSVELHNSPTQSPLTSPVPSESLDQQTAAAIEPSSHHSSPIPVPVPVSSIFSFSSPVHLIRPEAAIILPQSEAGVRLFSGLVLPVKLEPEDTPECVH